MSRRQFLSRSTAAGLVALLPRVPTSGETPSRPARLRPGDPVGLIDPASATFLESELEQAVEAVKALGLEPRLGTNLMKRYGYLAGSDAERAADIDAFFRDPEVRGVIAVRGGWGCARLLPLLDYPAIGRNPKLLLGYSDLTALLLAVYARTGLVTFHGPNALSAWSPISVRHFESLAFAAETPTLVNHLEAPTDRLVPRRYRTRLLTPGRARGRLLGGNLTVLSHLVGSPYLPDWDGAILFLEDIDEEIYRIDRMLNHLKLAGILARVSGVVFGTCSDCKPGSGYGSLTLEEVLDDHLAPLRVPAWSGAMFGHVDDQFTLPIGALAEIDAEAGSIRLLEAAVS